MHLLSLSSLSLLRFDDVSVLICLLQDGSNFLRKGFISVAFEGEFFAQVQKLPSLSSGRSPISKHLLSLDQEAQNHVLFEVSDIHFENLVSRFFEEGFDGLQEVVIPEFLDV